MAQQVINIGTNANDDTGELLRSGGTKINNNFTEIYALQSQTINAGSVDYNFTGATYEDRIALADADAVLRGFSILYIPAFMLPYDISLCPASSGVRRVREGGDSSVYDVTAYGAHGDTVTQDYASFAACLAATGLAQGCMVIPSSSGSYLVNNTLTLPPNIMVRGEASGLAAPIIRFNGGTKTLFDFCGTSEAQILNVALRDFQIDSATNQVGIGIRLRNFADVFLSGVAVAHFRVGLWTDWGQNVYLSNGCKFVLNERGIQLGGDKTQTENPVPSAGIAGGPVRVAGFMDLITLRDTQFSQNVIDINDMGSQTSLGVLKLDGCRFYESGPSPVVGKVKFVHITRRKAVSVRDCFVESPQSNRTGICLDAVDYDGVAADNPRGVDVASSHFLFTSATGGICIDAQRAAALRVETNVFEIATGGTTVDFRLADPIDHATIGANSYLIYPDGAFSSSGPRVTVSAGPQGGHVFRAAAARNNQNVTYSASMAIDPTQGEFFHIQPTNGTAFTINSPSPVRNGYLTVQILNGSGGALGVATWGANYKLTEGAWVQPANTLRRAITFWYNNSNWIEIGRTTSDY